MEGPQLDDSPDEHAPTEAAPTVLGNAEQPQPLAYSDDESPTLPYETERASTLRVVLIAVGIVAVAGAIAGGLLLAGEGHTPDHVVASTPDSAPAPVGPTDPHDREFITQLRRDNVPVDDWKYYVEYAKSLCHVAESGEPPGDFGFNIAQEVIRGKEPTWTTPQVLHFAAATYNWYCPRMWGPTNEELAKLAPDDQLIALLGSKAGLIAPTDPGQFVSNAKAICARLDSGVSRSSVIGEVDAGSSGNPQWMHETSTAFVEASVDVYCPAYKTP